jgi:hypothetical protein
LVTFIAFHNEDLRKQGFSRTEDKRRLCRKAYDKKKKV